MEVALPEELLHAGVVLAVDFRLVVEALLVVDVAPLVDVDDGPQVRRLVVGLEIDEYLFPLAFQRSL